MFILKKKRFEFKNLNSTFTHNSKQLNKKCQWGQWGHSGINKLSEYDE